MNTVTSINQGSLAAHKTTARALLLGDRIDTAGLERSDMISANPLAFQAGARGFVALYRFGVAVMIGLSPLEEDDVLQAVKVRVSGPHAHVDDEMAVLEISTEPDDKVTPGGAIAMKDLSSERLLVLADALAKSVSLGRDEREVNAVFDIIEPFAAQLAATGRPPWKRRFMLRLIGQTLLVQHRVSGRVAVEEKPDVLWDRPDLERLYARLEDEYELKERAQTLKNKLDVIGETARALNDMIDADRATRLEIIIVILIAAEILLSIAQMVMWHR
ncbi:RMD1 family protein [Methyloferula stellata]|uniref:RMD1 family protein n=1 Tax=Methyloferula stellata TaxID=876270 RepID=UPI000375265B|nr:RMD1 family protein [Methyloferula stellata]